MKSVAELQSERAAMMAECEKLLDEVDEQGTRPLKPEEKSKWDTAMNAAERLTEEIDRRKKFEAQQAKQLAEATARQPIETPTIPNDQPKAIVAPDRERVLIPHAHGKLISFPDTPSGHMDAYRSGMWLKAHLWNDPSAQSWCRSNGVGLRAAMSEGVNVAGGALVPEEFERAIIRNVETYGLARRVCRVSPMGSDTSNQPKREGGLTAYPVGEGEAGTESDASWSNILLTAKKWMVLTRMSTELNEDAVVDMANAMAIEIGLAFAYAEDNCLFNGTGTQANYSGIVGVFVKAIDGSHVNATIAATSPHNTFAELDADDLLKLMALLPLYAKPGSAWYCGPVAQELVFNAIKIAGGGNTRDLLADQDTPRFLGYPINVSPLLPDGATTDYNGAAMLGFGDLRIAATMGTRRGIRIGLSDQRYWENDQIGIKATERFDINVHSLGNAIANGTAGAIKSPFAVLTGTT